MHSQWVSIEFVQIVDCSIEYVRIVDRNSRILRAMNGKERNGEKWEESDKHKEN